MSEGTANVDVTKQKTANRRGARWSGPALILGALVFATGAVWYSQGATARIASAAPVAGPQSQIERGRYLVTVGGCNDCHTPFKMTEKGPEPDMARMLSGHPEQVTLPPAPKAQGPWVWSGAATNTAFAGPWGVTYAANLTPDKNTGLGIWDEAMFVQALRTGKHFGQGRPIMPPMPWQNYARMSDEDLRAVFAYLRSIPPVRNHVPDYVAPE